MDYKLRKEKAEIIKILKLETIALIMKINLDFLIQFIKQALILDGKNKKKADNTFTFSHRWNTKKKHQKVISLN